MSYIPDGDIFHIKRPPGMGNMVPFRIFAYCGKSFSPDDFPPLFKPYSREQVHGDICPGCTAKLVLMRTDGNAA